MKTLTDTQKKWALTACLLTALSFNLSAHVKDSKEISRDFASSEPVTYDIKRGDETRKAQAWKTGENGEYTVKIEAKAGCDCFKDGERVEIKVQSDTQDGNLKDVLKIATYEELAGKSAKAKDKDEDPNEENESEEEDDSLAIEESELQKERLDKEFARSIKNECGHVEENKETRCRTNVFIGILKKYQKRSKDKKPSDEQASKWLEEEVAIKIAESFQAEEPVAPNQLDFSSYGEYREAVQQYQSDVRIFRDKMVAAKNSIESLQERIPSGYTETRRKITQMVATIQQAAKEIYVSKLQELSKPGIENYQTTIATANAYQAQFSKLTSDLDRLVNSQCKLKGPTCLGVKAGNISSADANKIYREEYVSQFDSLPAAINNSIVTYNLRDSNGNIIVGPMGAPEVRVAIRPEILDTAVSESGASRERGRTSVVRTAPTGSVVYIGNKVYQEVGEATTAEPTTSVVTTSDALRFFDEMDASQESIRLRNELHRQYRINQ